MSKIGSCEVALDVGCGTGETFFECMIPSLNREGLKVVGIDKSKEMIEFAREKYGSVNHSFQVYDIESDLESIGDFIKADSFDLVTSSYCYNWVKDEGSVIWLTFFYK